MNDFVIIGGGIIGMLTARELAKHGSTTLIERGRTGREASWAGGGILSPLYPWRYSDPINRLAAWSQAHYPQLAEELLQHTGVDPEYRHSGLLMLDPGPEPDNGAAAMHRWAKDYAVPLETLRGDALHAREPGLRGDIGQGWWLPGIGQLRNPRLVRAARAAVDQAGVKVIEDREVTGIDSHGGRVTGVRTDQGTLPVGRVVVAAGSWSNRLLAPLGIDVPVTPVKGQMLVIKTPPETVKTIVLDHGRYLIPRRDGRVVIGSTLEQSGYDKGTSDDARDELHACAVKLMPQLADYPVEHQWAGLRPSSPGGIPYVGPHPAVDGLYINTGHFRNGVVLGLASSRLLADLMLAREPILDPAPYALDSRRPEQVF